MPAKRNYSTDLLRCILMIMITAHHIIVHSLNMKELGTGGEIAGYFEFPLFLLNALCIVGVNAFFFISGYYSIKLKAKKLIVLYFEMFFYLSIWYLIMLFSGEFKLLSAASLKYILNIIFPFETLWFMGVYFLLCVLSPFINDYINSLDKASQKKLLVIFSVIAVLYGFIFDWDGVGRGYTFLHGLFMYYIGMLCKKNKDDLPRRKLLYSGVYAGSALITAGAAYLAYRASFRGMAWTIYSYNDPLIIIGAVALCLLFTLWDSENAIAKFSSGISKYVLAAYFITVRTSVVFLPVKKFIEAGRSQAVIVLSIIIYSTAVFFICILIDKGRAALFSFLNKVFHLEDLYESICDRCGRSARF